MSENSFEIDKRYVSPIDKFLQQFDQDHPEKSASQQKEIEKHRIIAEKRDVAEE